MRRRLLFALLALLGTLAPLAAGAHPRVVVVTPRARVRVVPVISAPVRVRAWVPGHWRWSPVAGHRVWVCGHFSLR
jgi:hypothetical protein